MGDYMKLIDNELVDRYIYYFLRYIPYDRQKEAKENMLNQIEDSLPIDYTEKDVIKTLNKLGNPYQYAAYYTNGGRFLISGKTYEIFTKFLKILVISGLIGLILFFFNYFSRLLGTGVYTVVKSILISIFILSVLPSYISERIKDTKILNSLTSDWDISLLYESKKLKINADKIVIMILNYSMFFMLQVYMITANIDITTATYTFIMFLFFLNVLKDNLKMSENNAYSKIVYAEYFIDILTVLSLTVLTKFYIPNLFMIKTIIFTNVVNICMNIYRTAKEKRDRKKNRRNSRQNKYKQKD